MTIQIKYPPIPLTKNLFSFSKNTSLQMVKKYFFFRVGVPFCSLVIPEMWV